MTAPKSTTANLGRRLVVAVGFVTMLGGLTFWYLMFHRPEVQAREALTNEEVQQCLDRDPKTWEELVAHLKEVSTEERVSQIPGWEIFGKDKQYAVDRWFERLAFARKQYPNTSFVVYCGRWKDRADEVKASEVDNIFWIYGNFVGPGALWGAGGVSAGWWVLVNKEGSVIGWSKFDGGGMIHPRSDFGTPSWRPE